MTKATTALFVATIAYVLHAADVLAQSHIRCQNTIGGPCGDSSRPREYNCCDYGYCQPWNAGYYQCIDKPPLCSTQETDIDYYGNDLTSIRNIQPSACCSACSTTFGCKAYTFVNQNPDGKTTCYLKSATTGRIEKKGAVSGVLNVTPLPTPSNPPTPSPTPPVTCPNDIGATCGNAQATTCCRSGAYCQPWNAGYYQCQPNPQFCSVLKTDYDYYGNDLKVVYGLSPAGCCDTCAHTSLCRAFTFVNENPDGRTACYLKTTGSGPLVAKKGALASILIEDPLPPVTPAPTPTTCSNAIGAPCGNAQSGRTCCGANAFCQPWNAGYYQCIAALPPTKCGPAAVGVDYYGNDLETKYNLLPATCCEACANHPQCKAFTFVNENADGRSACYLKHTAGAAVAKASAISALKA